MPELVVHVLPPSHPCHAVQKALELKGLEAEQVVLNLDGSHLAAIEEVYGEGRRTVPGMLVDGEPVHGTSAIFERLEALAPEPALLPSEEVRQAERWADGRLQDMGRTLTWGSLHFRPEAMGTIAGGEPLDPAGTDFAMKFVRGSWKLRGITAVTLHADLQELPGLLDEADRLMGEGLLGTPEAPTAAGLQVGATLRVLRIVEDLHPQIDGRPAAALIAAIGPDLPGRVPAGAFPAGWVPAR